MRDRDRPAPAWARVTDDDDDDGSGLFIDGAMSRSRRVVAALIVTALLIGPIVFVVSLVLRLFRGE